jgi:protocatechuate 3,4-dioxygenase beta subunit
MPDDRFHPSRRGLLRGATTLGAVALFARGAFAEQLERTPGVTEGPFYPPRLPLDRDNDLIIVGDSTTPAVGEVTHLTGRILDSSGSPVKDALVEIGQCDANAVYLAQGDTPNRDGHFQGYGRFTTSSTGEYRFRTIKPVPYPGRPAPHIHYKIRKNNRELLTTQLFIAGHPGNARDGVFRGIGDPLERELVSVDFTPLKNSKAGELAARFDVVLGRTPADPEPDHRH